ncbi:type 4a pilus biogenesis protein PilO [Candidatus Omnitrophota bacterium]
MMYSKEKQKVFILFGIIGITVLMLYYNFLLRPQFRTFIVNNREFRAVRGRVVGARALIANESRIKKQYENVKKESGIFEKRLPAQDEIPSLLEDFSNIAEFSGVKILKIKPLELPDDVYGYEAGARLYSEVPILIEARSSYHQCGVFINKIENMDRFIKINGIDIRSSSRDPRHHDIRLKLVTYIRH